MDRHNPNSMAEQQRPTCWQDVVDWALLQRGKAKGLVPLRVTLTGEDLVRIASNPYGAADTIEELIRAAERAAGR
jgi:hypothetical protein